MAHAPTDASGAIISHCKKRPGTPRVIPPSGDYLDVKQIRLNARACANATQRSFANLIGVPVKTLRNWEQRRRKPTGPARILLLLIQRDPWIVYDVVNGQYQQTPTA